MSLISTNRRVKKTPNKTKQNTEQMTLHPFHNPPCIVELEGHPVEKANHRDHIYLEFPWLFGLYSFDSMVSEEINLSFPWWSARKLI